MPYDNFLFLIINKDGSKEITTTKEMKEDKKSLQDAKQALQNLSESWTGVDDFFSSLDKVVI